MEDKKINYILSKVLEKINPTKEEINDINNLLKNFLGAIREKINGC